MQTATTVEREPTTYLNVDHTLKSWLLTEDHKRICLLYLIVVTIFFFIGGAFAALIRIELATPAGDLVESSVYNKLFTMHGIIMVFFFLIPSIPATLGNFLIPPMIGAKDVAFPKLNLLSWYLYVIGGSMTLFAVIAGGVDTGWTFYTPFSSGYASGYVTLTALGIFVNGFSSILTGTELRSNYPSDASARNDLVPASLVYLVSVCDQFDSGTRNARNCRYLVVACLGTRAAHWYLRSEFGG